MTSCTPLRNISEACSQIAFVTGRYCTCSRPRGPRDRAEEDRKEQHKRRKTLLRTKGVSTQNAELISSNPEEPLPSAVTRELDRYEEEQRRAREHKRREAARIAFENAWVRTTEIELKECYDKLRTSDEPSVRANLKAYMRMLSENLKDHHMSLGTYGTAEALAERKRICTALGLLSENKQHLVTNVWERLPVITSEEDTAPEQGVGQDLQDENEDEDEEAIFITPVPSTRADCSRKRKRHSNSQGASNAAFRTNAITKYFNKKKSVTQ